MKIHKVSGLLTSEIFTYLLIATILAAVAFGMVVSGERDDMVEQAEASIETIKEQSEADATNGELLVCNDALVAPEVLANSFLSLSIEPIPKDEADESAGYVPGLYIHSRKEEDGNDTFVTAKRLFEVIKEADESRLRKRNNNKERIEYYVLISDTVSCVDPSPAASDSGIGG